MSIIIRRVSLTLLALMVSAALMLILTLPKPSAGATPKKKGAVMKKAPNASKKAPSKKKLNKGASVSSALEEEDIEEEVGDGEEEEFEDEDLDEEDEDLDEEEGDAVNDTEDVGDEEGGDTGAPERAVDENVKDVAPWKVEDAQSAIASQRGVIKHIRDMVQEYKFGALFADELKTLKALEQELAQYEKALKQPVVRWETIDLFDAEDFGGQTDPIQRRVELQEAVSNVQGAKTILRSLVKNPKFVKSFTLLGGKIAQFKAAVPKFVAAADEALAALQELAEQDEITGEDITDVMETLQEENNPIALAGFLNGIKDFEKELKLNQILDKDLRKRVTAIVRDLFEDIIAALSSGDVDGATEAIADLSQVQIIQELPGLIDKAIAVSKMKKRKAKDLTKILDQFKALDKALDAADEEDAAPVGATP